MHICRVLLGVIFLVAGINGYVVLFGFEPFIETSPQAMALFQFDYLLFIEKSIEIICGILLLMNYFVPLVITLLSPIVANIFLLHLFLDHSLLPLAIILVIAYGYLVHSYWRNFQSLFEKKPQYFM